LVHEKGNYTIMPIKSYQMSFQGEVLDRGFWLYVWEIVSGKNRYFYVGRTGDSSSAHAASPFNRIGQHLDFRENAKGNSLAKRLKEVGVNPRTSNFRMLALGPFFPEQVTFDKHKPFRDQMATYEYELANYLKIHGCNVLGSHHIGSTVNNEILGDVKAQVMRFVTG
jgi:hypothetical protein